MKPLIVKHKEKLINLTTHINMTVKIKNEEINIFSYKINPDKKTVTYYVFDEEINKIKDKEIINKKLDEVLDYINQQAKQGNYTLVNLKEK